MQACRHACPRHAHTSADRCWLLVGKLEAESQGAEDRIVNHDAVAGGQDGQHE